MPRIRNVSIITFATVAEVFNYLQTSPDLIFSVADGTLSKIIPIDESRLSILRQEDLEYEFNDLMPLAENVRSELINYSNLMEVLLLVNNTIIRVVTQKVNINARKYSLVLHYVNRPKFNVKMTY